LASRFSKTVTVPHFASGYLLESAQGRETKFGVFCAASGPVDMNAIESVKIAKEIARNFNLLA
jgi:hypothetical protein